MIFPPVQLWDSTKYKNYTHKKFITKHLCRPTCLPYILDPYISTGSKEQPLHRYQQVACNVRCDCHANKEYWKCLQNDIRNIKCHQSSLNLQFHKQQLPRLTTKDSLCRNTYNILQFGFWRIKLLRNKMFYRSSHEMTNKHKSWTLYKWPKVQHCITNAKLTSFRA